MGCGDDGDGAPADAGGGAGDATLDAGVDAALPPGPYAATEAGTVMGTEEGTLHVFRGIPYAAPPVGELRFKRPEPHPGWEGHLDASAFGPICPQRAMMGTDVVGEEDCLTLNVWTHADRAPRPVMVFIHGGASIQGAGSLALYDGSRLAENGDVVVVTLNYRLGTLGYLATEALVAEDADGSAGNWGILDQQTALGWVRRNIAAFGGDPANVTVFGESAGALSICVHLGSPLADGLFDRAIMESGGGCFGYPALRTAAPNRTPAIEMGELLTAAAGCDGATDRLACMREKTPEELVNAMYSVPTMGLGLPDIGPNVDGVVLTEQPYALFERGEARDVPIVIGSNADEATIFTAAIAVPDEATYEMLVRAQAGVLADDILAIYPASDFATPKEAFNALYSDLGFICPALAFAEVSAGGTAPTFTYHFTKTLEGLGATLGAFHALELFYVFGNFETLARYTPVAVDFTVSENVQGAWTTFATSGTPVTEPAWPAFDAASPGILVIDEPMTVATEIREGRCAELRALGVF